jgi:hypothetical protein
LQPELNALVVGARGEASEAGFLRAGILGRTAKLADGADGNVDVVDREIYGDAPRRLGRAIRP